MATRSAKKASKSTSKSKVTAKKSAAAPVKKVTKKVSAKSKPRTKTIAKAVKQTTNKLSKAKKAPVKLPSKTAQAKITSSKTAKPAKQSLTPSSKLPSANKKATTAPAEKKKVVTTTKTPEKITLTAKLINNTKESIRPPKEKSRGTTTSTTVTGSHISTMGIMPYQALHDEEYMNVQQRDHFRKILMAWKQQLMEEVDRTVHHMQDEAANFPDPNDRATQEEEFSLELRARDRERKLIKKIDEALQKIENDEYGYCETCGVEIGIRRLEARPTATLCIDCKTIDEIREKNYT